MSAGTRVRLRDVRPGDAGPIVALVTACFEEYREIAPAGWEPPSQRDARERVEARLGRPSTGGTVATLGGEHAGHVLWIPATASGRIAGADRATAYLWQLFVAPGRRGGRLAPDLLARAVVEARARGYREMRLLTVGEHRRARRFYEREGWSLLGDWGRDPELRLDLVEYGRRLPPASGHNGAP